MPSGLTTGLGMFQELLQTSCMRYRLCLPHPILIYDMSANFISWVTVIRNWLCCGRVFGCVFLMMLSFAGILWQRSECGTVGAKLQHSGKICHSAILSPTNPTWTVLRCNTFGTRPKKMRISQRLFIRFWACIYDYIPCFMRSMPILVCRSLTSWRHRDNDWRLAPCRARPCHCVVR